MHIIQRLSLPSNHRVIIASFHYTLNTNLYLIKILRMRKNFDSKRMWCKLIIPLFFLTAIITNGNAQDLLANYDIGAENLTIVNAQVSKEKISETQYVISYHHNNDRAISPYVVKYKYNQTNHQNHVELPMKSFLGDLDMYFEDGVTINAIGSDIVSISNNLEQGQILDPARAEYDIAINDINLISYKIELNDRKVIGSEMIEVNNQLTKAFIVQSTLQINKILDSGSELSSSEEVIQDWFVADYGVAKRRRINSLNSNGEVSSTEIRF